MSSLSLLGSHFIGSRKHVTNMGAIIIDSDH